MKKKIPKGWEDYLPYGDKVEGTKFLPFKTPLKLEMQYSISQDKRFTPACLMANMPKLKAVIDLTDTDSADRYYRPTDFIDANVEHLKIKIAGGGAVPGSAKIKEFSDAVDRFLEKHAADPDALIGVHCTHGLNRTGYFICMYMVTRMSYDPKDSINNFQKARGYEMYRHNFIEEILEPGRHSSRPQKPNYGRNNEDSVRQIGNYSYENNWLEGRSRKPFKGFHESETELRERGNRRERRDQVFERREQPGWEGNQRKRHQPRKHEESLSGKTPRGASPHLGGALSHGGEGRGGGLAATSWRVPNDPAVSEELRFERPPGASGGLESESVRKTSRPKMESNQSCPSSSRSGGPIRNTERSEQKKIWRQFADEDITRERSWGNMEYASPLDGQYEDEIPRRPRWTGNRKEK